MARSQTLKILVSALVILGAAGYLLADTFKNSEAIDFFYPADQVMALRTELVGKRVRMGGFVKKGSIIQKKGTFEYQFEVRPIEGMLKHPEFKDSTLTIEYTGIVPDTFKDDAEVIVAGSLVSETRFVAKDLVAKCPSKYEAAEKSDGSY